MFIKTHVLRGETLFATISSPASLWGGSWRHARSRLGGWHYGAYIYKAGEHDSIYESSLSSGRLMEPESIPSAPKFAPRQTLKWSVKRHDDDVTPTRANTLQSANKTWPGDNFAFYFSLHKQDFINNVMKIKKYSTTLKQWTWVFWWINKAAKICTSINQWQQ